MIRRALNAEAIRGCAMLVSFVLFAFLLAGCAAKLSNEPIEISSIRPVLPNTKLVQFKVSRQEYLTAMGRNELNHKARMIEIFQSADIGSPAIPEYRFFNILPRSVYWVLGLRTADVLVGAHDLVVRSPVAFERYISVLSLEKSSQIEVRRDGQPTLLKFEFID